MDKEQMKAELKNYLSFVRCACGMLYRLKNRFVVLSEAKHICPNCRVDVVEVGTLISFDEGCEQVSKKLLPIGVRQVGEGIHMTYEADDPRIRVR